MEYIIQITRTVENPDYKELMERWRDDQKYNYRGGFDSVQPEPFFRENVLLANLTEEQYNDIKNNVFLNWK